jgi:hypothetical protein
VKHHVAAAVFLFFCLVSSSPAQARFPGREVAKPQSEVRDSFLSYFIGLVDSDCVGYADGPFLHEILPEFHSFYSLPFEQIHTVRRSHAGDGVYDAVDFDRGLTLPIPFRLIFVSPGTITASQSIVYRETRYPSVVVRADGGDEITLSPMYVFEQVSGRFQIDFDPWIHVFFGRIVDDVNITRVLLFLDGGTWYGALMGRGSKGQLVAGYFDFKENRILVPVPRRFAALGTRFPPP